MLIGQPCIYYLFTSGTTISGPPSYLRVATNVGSGRIDAWGLYLCYFRLRTINLGFSYSMRATLVDGSGSTPLWFHRHEGRSIYPYFGEQVSQGAYPAGPPWYYVNPFRNKSGTAENSLPGATKRSPSQQYQIRPEPYYFMAQIDAGQRLEIDCKQWQEDAYARDGLSNPPHLTDSQPTSGDGKVDEIQVNFTATVELWMMRV
jgi:hypothetical protein